MKVLLTTAAVALVLLVTGCAHHHYSAHPHGMPPGQAKKLGHAHGHACGHVEIDGVWVLSDHGKKPGHGKSKKKN